MREGEVMNPKQPGRRKFLKGSATLVGMAVAGIQSTKGQPVLDSEVIRPTEVRPLGELSHFEKSVRKGYITQYGHHALTPLQDSEGIITPAPLHFFVSHEPGGIL